MPSASAITAQRDTPDVARVARDDGARRDGCADACRGCDMPARGDTDGGGGDDGGIEDTGSEDAIAADGAADGCIAGARDEGGGAPGGGPSPV